MWTNFIQELFEQFQGKFSRMVISIVAGSNHNWLNEPEEDWKIEAEESDSDIDAGDMSDGDVERRIRARRI